MALLDDLLQYAISIDFDDYPIIGQTASRNQSITTIQASPRFWKFTVDMQTPILTWADNRALVQNIRNTAMFNPFSFTLANTPNLQSIVAYQGVLSSVQLAAITVRANQGTTLDRLYLENLPASISNVFKTGDFIQVGNAVRTCLYDVTSISSGYATVFLSDPLVAYPTVGAHITTGTAVTWNNCYFTDLPAPGLSYEFIDGITWTGKFKMVQTLS